MMAIRGGKIPNGYRFEYDLMQYVRDRLNRKIEADGEKALELALAEIGYVKERTCYMESVWGTNALQCSECCSYVSTWDAECNIGKINYCPTCGAKVLEPCSNLLGQEEER